MFFFGKGILKLLVVRFKLIDLSLKSVNIVLLFCLFAVSLGEFKIQATDLCHIFLPIGLSLLS